MSKSKAEKTEDKTGSATGMIRLFWRFIGDQRRLFTVATLMLIFEAITAVLIPLLVAFVIDYLAQRLQQLQGTSLKVPQSPFMALHLPTLINPDVDTLLIVTVGMIVLTMVNSLADSLAEINLAQAGRRIGFHLRVSLYAHLQKLSLAFHDQRRTGDVLTRITSDVAALEDFIISSFSDFAGSILLIVFILAAMIHYRWQVAIVAAVIVPVMALISSYFTTRIKSASKKRRASEGELASAAQEMLTSIRVIQTYGLGSMEQEMFSDQSQKAMDAALDAARLQAQFSWVVSVLGAFSTAVVIWMAVYLIFQDPLLGGIGLLTAFIKYIQDMFKPTKRIIQEWNTMGKLSASLERVADLLDRKPAVQDAPGAVEAPPVKGHIQLDHVAFAYPVNANDPASAEEGPRMILKNVNLEIEPGQVVAVVGHTGAGKSTIVQLLPRLYDPTAGKILIDGHDIREFKLDSLRAQMSMVLQETILFSGSVVENIAYGRTDATWGEIIEAAKQANAHEFIEKLPQGYYTLLGERGSNLSGGQRQRLAIARAFIRNTPILIMDEPSTGLDAESTDLVLQALKKLMKGKTTIIISHDLGLIREADKIVVIKAGEIEQSGTHEELLQAGGLYSTLYHLQTGQPEVEKVAPQLSGKELKELAPGEQAVKNQVDPLDLLKNPLIQAKLPHLVTSFDALAMRNALQQVLFGMDNPDFTIERVIPGKAILLPENNCNLQYGLEVKENSSGEVLKHLVNARLFPDLESCQSYLHEQLEPLVPRMRGRPEIAHFPYPVAMIEDLWMTLSVFPIDGMLPTLVKATDRQRMVRILNETLPDALSGNLEVEDLHMELAHYGRFRRCVLRYMIEGKIPENGEPVDQMIYGKVDGDGSGGLTVAVIAALRERPSNGYLSYPFNIPRALGFLPELKLLLMEAIPGSPQIANELKAHFNGDSSKAGKLDLNDAMDACAKIAASLHSSGIKLGRRRGFEQEMDNMQRSLQSIQDILPDLGGKLLQWLDEIGLMEAQSNALPLCFSHGDFTYTQLIFNENESGLVDFDTVCQAEPALDLGQFLAYQQLAITRDWPGDPRKAAELSEKLGKRFLDTYIAVSKHWLEDEGQLRERVSIYERISLLRLALHSWQKLKGSRLKVAIALLEEKMSWPVQLS